MGNESSTSSKKLFDQLDKTKDGVLTLDDLLTVGGSAEHFSKSPLLLFRFDDGEDGALSKEEFENYIRHLQEHKKKSEKKQKDDDKKKKRDEKKKGEKVDKKEKKDEDENYAVAWVTLDKETAGKMKFSRDSETPAIIGASPPGAGTDKASSEDHSVSSSDETNRFLANILRRSEGRKRYMTWLFRLADVDGDGDLEAEELELILKALEHDGIETKTLSFHPAEEGSTSTLAQKLLEEYNVGKTGFLTKEEFMSLADLIMRHYEARSEKPKRCIGKYELKRKLGCGSNSVVRLGTFKDSGERKAIKIIKRGDVSDMSRVDTELKAMMMLDHASIVKLEEVLENEDHVFFVMELCGGGSLSNYLERKPFSEPLARYYMPQLLDGLRYCHKKGVCHRDLKLENLVIDNSGHLKMTDFGHAGIYRKGWDLFSTGLVGSLYHISPEQIAGQCYSGEKIDIWGVGIILYRLLTGNPPFFNANTQEMFKSIMNVDYKIPDHLSEDAKDLISVILKANPDERPSCSKILKHPWFKGPVKLPALASFVLQLDGKIAADLVWAELCSLVTALNMHLIRDTSNKHHHCLHAVKCVDPKREIKFSIVMKTRKAESEPPYVEFNLKEGEAWDFSQTVYKIRAGFRRWKRRRKLAANSEEVETAAMTPNTQRKLSLLSIDKGENKVDQDKKAKKPEKTKRDEETKVDIDGEETKKVKGDEKKGREKLKATIDSAAQTTVKTKLNKREQVIDVDDSDQSSSSSESDEEEPQPRQKKKVKPLPTSGLGVSVTDSAELNDRALGSSSPRRGERREERRSTKKAPDVEIAERPKEKKKLKNSFDEDMGQSQDLEHKKQQRKPSKEKENKDTVEKPSGKSKDKDKDAKDDKPKDKEKATRNKEEKKEITQEIQEERKASKDRKKIKEDTSGPISTAATISGSPYLDERKLSKELKKKSRDEDRTEDKEVKQRKESKKKKEPEDKSEEAVALVSKKKEKRKDKENIEEEDRKRDSEKKERIDEKYDEEKPRLLVEIDGEKRKETDDTRREDKKSVAEENKRLGNSNGKEMEDDVDKRKAKTSKKKAKTTDERDITSSLPIRKKDKKDDLALQAEGDNDNAACSEVASTEQPKKSSPSVITPVQPNPVITGSHIDGHHTEGEEGFADDEDDEESERENDDDDKPKTEEKLKSSGSRVAVSLSISPTKALRPPSALTRSSNDADGGEADIEGSVSSDDQSLPPTRTDAEDVTEALRTGDTGSASDLCTTTEASGLDDPSCPPACSVHDHAHDELEALEEHPESQRGPLPHMSPATSSASQAAAAAAAGDTRASDFPLTRVEIGGEGWPT